MALQYKTLAINYHYSVLLDYFPFIMHLLTSLIKFAVWLKALYRQKAGGGHGLGLFWDDSSLVIGFCSVIAAVHFIWQKKKKTTQFCKVIDIGPMLLYWTDAEFNMKLKCIVVLTLLQWCYWWLYWADGWPRFAPRVGSMFWNTWHWRRKRMRVSQAQSWNHISHRTLECL